MDRLCEIFKIFLDMLKIMNCSSQIKRKIASGYIMMVSIETILVCTIK